MCGRPGSHSYGGPSPTRGDAQVPEPCGGFIPVSVAGIKGPGPLSRKAVTWPTVTPVRRPANRVHRGAKHGVLCMPAR